MIGQTLAGHYYILSRLGKGGFGKTYLAKDLLLPDKQHCVVKQFEPPENILPEALAQARHSFEREAMVLNDIGREHPQIPRLLAYLENNGQFFLVQEYIEGHDLSKEIEPGKTLPETEVINLLDEVLSILEFIHQRNIIHRDIKPSNIMRRGKDGKLFLIDFGTVKQQIPTEIVTVAGEVKSKFAFISEGYTPDEQLKLKPKLASDLYALGMMAIFALTGVHPSQIPEDRETGEIKWRDGIKIEPKLADIIDKMVRHDYRDRYPSAIEARQALTELLNPTPPPTKIPTKIPLVKTLLVTSALLLALVGGNYYFRQQPQTPVILTYENADYGIEMEYPDDWVLEKVEDPFGTVARLYPEKDASVEVTLEAINIDSNTSFDEYTTSVINRIIKYLPEAKIIDSQAIELDNKPAHRVVYTGKKKDSNLTNKYLQVWFKEADKVFIVTYVAPEDKYQDFSQTVEQTMTGSLNTGDLNN